MEWVAKLFQLNPEQDFASVFIEAQQSKHKNGADKNAHYYILFSL